MTKKKRQARTRRIAPPPERREPASAPAAPSITWDRPTYSPKRKRVAVSGTLPGDGLTILLTGSPAAIRAAEARYNDGGPRPVVDLAGGLLAAKPATRVGRFSRRRLRLSGIKQYAAMTYLFLRQWRWRGAPPDVDQVLQRARDILKGQLGGLPAPRDQTILLTAFLVYSAFRPDWQELKLKNPLAAAVDEDRAVGAVDSFYQTYIRPGLRGAEAMRRSPAARRLFDEGQHPLLLIPLGCPGSKRC